MKEFLQYDVRLDQERFSGLLESNVSTEQINQQKNYIERQLKTDIGERLDRAQSHYVYEIKEGKLFGQGETEPFESVIQRGVVERFDGSRENAELIGFRLIQSVLADPQTPDGTTIFNPSPPDGKNYQKNYLDVHKKVGRQVHSIRYFSDVSNEGYREKILQINPNYAEAIPQKPKDTDFLLNPVVVPSHLRFEPDQLAELILEEKKGISEPEFEEIWSQTSFLWTSYINTLVENPNDLAALEQKYKAGLNAAQKAKEGEYKPKYDFPKMEIQYLASEPVKIGGGGCGSGACSTSSVSKEFSFAGADKFGSREFACPSCGEKNTRPVNQLISNCQGCGSEKVLPKTLLQ